MDSVKLTTEGVITTSIVSALTTHLLVQFKEPYLIHVVLLAFAFPPLLTAFFVSAGKPLASAAGYTTLALSIYASLLTTSILLYRVFFHRTAGLKGPKLAPLSKLWYGIVSAGGHIDLRVRELHHQYSDIVRTGPNDLSICHVDAIAAVMGTQTKLPKGRWTDAIFSEGSHRALLAMSDYVAHGERRKDWDRGFTGAALASYAISVRHKTDLFVERIKEVGTKGPIDLELWSNFLSFDIMGELGFGESFGMLEKGKPHSYLTTIKENMSAMICVKECPWVTPLLGWLPLTPGIKDMMTFGTRMRKSRQERGMPADPDVYSYLTGEASGASNGLTLGELDADINILILAGSETSATTLTCAAYYLARNPIWIDRLREEIFPYLNMEISELRDLPILNAIIHETLRLRPSVPGKSPRYTHPEGLTVAGEFIPGCVNVSVPQLAVMTDARYFSPKPNVWRPERWIEPEKEDALDIRAYFPFSFGACISDSPSYNLIADLESFFSRRRRLRGKTLSSQRATPCHLNHRYRI